MSFVAKKESERFDLAVADPAILLTDEVRHSGWEQAIGLKNAFYVLGFTWFRNEVLRDRLNVTDCGSFIGEMKAVLNQRPAWIDTPFPWSEQFGARQFIDAASAFRSYAPNFPKAAQIILLCEVIANHFHKKYENGPSGADVYDHMAIEPALSYIHDFDLNAVDRLIPEQRVQLRRWTGQLSNEVFVDMANGATVTMKLARRTLHFFRTNRPDIDLGDVDWRLTARRRGKPSKAEMIDVKEFDLSPEAIA